MSWIRSAVNRAVEAGGNNQLSSTVRSYAGSVVQKAGKAVVGGAKLFQDRIGARNFQSYKLAVKRLEEVSVSCRGVERVQLLRRWLVALNEIERLNDAVNNKHPDLNNESNDSFMQPTVILYYDPDLHGEPLNFRDVFLHSQALEGMTLSLILEEPNDEESSLLLEMFGLCLMGGKEAHHVTVNSIQDLAKAFSSYTNEVLAKREELLQHAQEAIAGLKVNAEIVRIDSEVSSIRQKLDENQLPLSVKSPEAACETSIESLKKALESVALCSRLEELLLWKKALKTGDSHIYHNQKLDKMKVLSESLAVSTSKAEKRILDNRTQKEEALKFRLAKTREVNLLEKELVAEIEALENKKDDLEDALKKELIGRPPYQFHGSGSSFETLNVLTALTSANSRLHNAREEREQFDVASSQILQHFKLKEDELSRAIATYRAEAEVCNRFVNFLETSWGFQSSYAEQKDKLVNEELERHEEYFVNLAVSILSTLKVELGSSISSVREILENLKLVRNLKRLDSSVNEEKVDVVNPRKRLEEQYQSLESRFLTGFDIVASIRNHLHPHEIKIPRVKGNLRLADLLDSLDEIKEKFESMERPTLEMKNHVTREEMPFKAKTPRVPFISPKDRFEYLSGIGKQRSHSEGQLSMLKFELELDDHDLDNSMEGIVDWEFDDKIEKEQRKRL